MGRAMEAGTMVAADVVVVVTALARLEEAREGGKEADRVAGAVVEGDKTAVAATVAASAAGRATV